MDTAIYLGTVVLTVIWSVWTYLSWSDHARLSDTSAARFFLIIGPSGYFLLIALAGWGKALSFRFDLIGIIVLDVITLLSWFMLLIVRWIKVRNYRGIYIFILVSYNIVALGLVILIHMVKLFPPLLILLGGLIYQAEKIDFFKFAWIGLDPETHENDLVSMLNKILIALLSYIPISLLRSIYTNRQRRRMAEEIGVLRGRIENLESRLGEDEGD